MVLGLGRVVVAVVALGCAPVEPAATGGSVKAPPLGEAQPAKGVAAAPAVAGPAAGAVEVRAQGDAVWEGEASYQGEELVALLRERRGAALVLSVRVAADASDRALGEALEAAPRAGFEQVWLERAGETLTIATSNGDDRARILAWRSNDRIVGYDLQVPVGTDGGLGPFEIETEEGRTALRRRLAGACQDPCRVELALLPETPPRMWQTLSGWQQSVGSITTVSSRVLGIVPRPAANPSPSVPPPGSSAPKVKMGATTVSGRLPPRVIQHVFRSNFEKFRTCYEDGLGRNSSLEGRVSIRFVIGRNGKVSNVADGGSDIPDPEVVSCVLKATYTIDFPPPANGIVTVVYPILFAPG